MTTAPKTDRADPLGGHSGQWGLAALLIAFMAILVMPIALAAMLGLWIGAWHVNTVEWRHIEYGIRSGRLLLYGLLALTLFGVFCGAMGLARSLRRNQPIGLSLAGTLAAALSVAAAGVLIGTGEYLVEDSPRLKSEHSRFRPASAELIQEVKATVEKNPKLKAQWDKAMKDGTLTELEAEDIMLASGLWKRVPTGRAEDNFR